VGVIFHTSQKSEMASFSFLESLPESPSSDNGDPTSWMTEFYPLLEIEKLDELYRMVVEKGISRKFTRTAYMRYLTACNSDVSKACAAMEEHLRWRIEKDVDALSVDLCPNEFSKRFCIVGNVDRVGRPLIYNIIKRHNKNQRDILEFERFIICNMESSLRASNPLEEKLSIIMDLNGFGLINMDYEMLKLLITILQDNYRECLFRVFVLDAPWIFNACWVIIKPWIDPRTAQKVFFVKQQELEEYVDLSLFSGDLEEVGITSRAMAEGSDGNSAETK